MTGNGSAGFSKAKDTIAEKSGLSDWRIHDIRRTVASGMTRIGTALPVIEKILNMCREVSGEFVAVSKARFRGRKRAALKAWTREVERIASGKTAAVVQMPDTVRA
jgi:hypothetical protein